MNPISFIKKFFAVESLVPEAYRTQDIPKTKEVYQRTLKIAWPSAMEAILISLIGAVDMIMVGGLGTNALAAVGIGTQPRFLLMAPIFALNMGITVIVSRRKGANDQEGANRTLRNGLMISVILSLLMSVIGILYARPILLFAGATLAYIDTAVSFFQILMIGNFFYLISLTMTAAQRGAGNTKISLVTNLTANIVNITFNYPLIYGFMAFQGFGANGSAMTTAFGNLIALIIATHSLLKKDNFLHINFKQNWHFDKETLSSLGQISGSAFIEQIFLRIGFLMYSKAVANLGVMEYATHYIAMQVMSLSFSVGEGLSIATSSLVGQSLGAKRKDLAIIFGKASQRLGFVFSTIVALMIIVLRSNIMLMFSRDATIIALGSNVLIILAFSVYFQIAQVITMGSLRGAGDVKFVAMLSIVSVTVLRPTLTYIMAYSLGFGLYGAWFSVFIDQGIRYLVSLVRFGHAKWLNIEV